MSTFEALRYRDFRLLWIGFNFAQIGEPMQLFALGWYLVDLAVREGAPERGPLYLGLLGLSKAIPGLAFGLFGGVLIDRTDRRALLAWTYFASALIAVALAALAFGGALGIGWVLALSFAGSMAGAIDVTGLYAIAPQLVPRRSMLSAIGLTNITITVSMMVGPLIGGVLIGPAAIGGVLALEAMLRLVAVATLLLTRPVPFVARKGQAGILGSLGEGLTYVVREPLIRWLVGLSALVSLFGRSTAQLYPAIAHDILRVGAVELSWLLAARGFGTLVGSLTTASLGGLARPGVAVGAGVLLYGGVVALLVTQRDLVPALILAGLSGFAHFVFSGTSNGLLQARALEELRGRALSLYTTTIRGVGPLGVLILGSIGAVIGIGPAVGAGGVMLVIAGAYAMFGVRPLRDHRRELAARAAAASEIT